jgi:hypothetical protein
MLKTKKQKHLVIQHLENISGQVLDDFPEVIKSIIKGKAGVYALYHKQKLYYVGLATNLMSRLKIHLRDRHRGAWDRFSVFLTMHNEHMKELESLLLRINQPNGNKVGGKFIKSQNLRSYIHKKIKAHTEDKIALLMGGQFAERRRKTKMRFGKGLSDMAGIVEGRKVLLAKHKGKKYIATLRKDGSIGYKGKQYKSPTAVAKLVTGRKAINGWEFWKIKNDKNVWVKLDDLRE